MLIKFILYVYYVKFVQSAHILAIVSTPSYSHNLAFKPIWRELTLRGHQVTLLTTVPMKDASLTSLTEIDLHFSKKFKNSHLINTAQKKFFGIIQQMWEVNRIVEEQQLLHPEVQKLFDNKTYHFDLVLTEYFTTTMYAFSELFNCPLVTLSSSDLMEITYSLTGNPVHPVLYPDIFLPYLPPLSFNQRLISIMTDIYVKYCLEFYIFPEQTLFVRKMFGENFPSIQELHKKISLTLVNTNPVLHTIRPLLPTIIQFGQRNHLASKDTLPKDLRTFLDAAVQGVVYFSLGSTVQIKHLPKNVFQLILEVLEELPYKIILKCDSKNFAKRSDKMIISQWLPQQAILEHPNVKAFITQGGMKSIEEAVFTHTPMLGLPVYADQPKNIKSMEHKGVALFLDHKTMTKEMFKNSIMEIMENPRYMDKIKELAKLAKDTPMTGVDTAVWWIEYVIRHKGAKHLHGNIELPLYQYLFLDLICFILAIVVLMLCIIAVTFRFIYKMCNFLFKVKVKRL